MCGGGGGGGVGFQESPEESTIYEHLRRTGSRYSWQASQGPHIKRRECFNPLDMAEESQKVQSESWPLALVPWGAVVAPARAVGVAWQGSRVRVRKQSQHAQAPREVWLCSPREELEG